MNDPNIFVKMPPLKKFKKAKIRRIRIATPNVILEDEEEKVV